MGNTETIEEHVDKEFSRVKKKANREYITVEEVRSVKSLEDVPINFKKLAVLFVLDFEKNGKFSKQKFVRFGKWCSPFSNPSVQKNTNAIQAELEAQCSLMMWKQISHYGQKLFCEWFVRLFSVGMIKKVKPNTPATPLKLSENLILLSTDAAVTLHEILNIGELYGVTCPVFIGMMQQVAQEMGLLHQDARYENVVVVQILHMFAEHFIRGFMDMMDQMGFDPAKLLATEKFEELPATSTLEVNSDENRSAPSTPISSHNSSSNPLSLSLNIPSLNNGSNGLPFKKLALPPVRGMPSLDRDNQSQQAQPPLIKPLSIPSLAIPNAQAQPSVPVVPKLSLKLGLSIPAVATTAEKPPPFALSMPPLHTKQQQQSNSNSASPRTPHNDEDDEYQEESDGSDHYSSGDEQH